MSIFKTFEGFNTDKIRRGDILHATVEYRDSLNQRDVYTGNVRVEEMSEFHMKLELMHDARPGTVTYLTVSYSDAKKGNNGTILRSLRKLEPGKDLLDQSN
jgi:hypothetical protein